jgi:hypothetical protein
MDHDLPLKGARLALGLWHTLKCRDLRDGLVAARYDDFLAALGAFDKLREIGFRFVDGVDRHGAGSLANQLS